MPRLARKDIVTSFFHVMSQGIAKENIMKEEKLKKKYLELVNDGLLNTDLILVAYCVMDNHAHLLLYVKNIEELSKFMQRLNCEYAKYYNYFNDERVGFVFRNRFLSEPITTQRYLNNCIKYIHQNPVKANIVNKSEDYKYSSYVEYKNKNGIFQKVTNNEIIKQAVCYDSIINNENIEGFLETEIETEKVLENKIKEFEMEINMKLEDILTDKRILILLINELKACYKIKCKDIMKKLNITKWEWDKLMY